MKVNEKYIKMHKDLLDSCYDKGLKVFPGKIAAYEIISETVINGSKDFFMFSKDLDMFINECIDQLKKMGYLINVSEENGTRTCKVLRGDILATTVHRVITNPEGSHHPEIILRELTEKQELCDSDELNYMGSIVNAKSDLIDYLKIIYGEDYQISDSFVGYTIFSEMCSQEELIAEAKKKGYISKERVSRYKKHRKWRREERNPIEKEYNVYVDVLLGLK